MKAIIIFNTGIGNYPNIVELDFESVGDVWDNLDEIWMKLKRIAENDRFKCTRAMQSGDMIKMENNKFYLCCDEGFIEV